MLLIVRLTNSMPVAKRPIIMPSSASGMFSTCVLAIWQLK